MSARILVVGGAGSIGLHRVKLLGQQGCRVTTLDDLSSGHRDAVLTGEFVEGIHQGTEVAQSLSSCLEGPAFAPITQDQAAQCARNFLEASQVRLHQCRRHKLRVL